MRISDWSSDVCSSDLYVPCASPGSLAPHAWLPDGGSLYDLFGDGYTLLVLDNFDAPDIQRARAEAERVGVRLAIAPVSEPKLSSLYKSSRALVRPEQLVSWRGDERSEERRVGKECVRPCRSRWSPSH